MRYSSAILGPALVALPLFAVTNADDLVLLTLFFANPRTRPSAIVTGQLAGIVVIIIASLLAARLALTLPANWLPLLGLAPIAIGLRQFFSSDRDETKLPPSVGWFAVAATTVANGGDNLAVYVPVFANSPALAITIICTVFLLLTLVWCALAQQVVMHPRWGATLRKGCNLAAPYVLVFVGLWVLARHPWLQAQLGN